MGTTRGKGDLPTAWIKRIRESMATLTPRFSAERAVREYTETDYIAAAKAVKERLRSSTAWFAGSAAWCASSTAWFFDLAAWYNDFASVLFRGSRR